MLFTKGVMDDIDQRHYFRDEVFNGLDWHHDTAPGKEHTRATSSPGSYAAVCGPKTSLTRWIWQWRMGCAIMSAVEGVICEMTMLKRKTWLADDNRSHMGALSGRGKAETWKSS